MKIEFLLFCDSRQDKEHPEVDAKEQDDLEDDLAHDRLSEVEGSVHHHGPKLDQDHDQERSRHLILREGRGDVCRWVFLEAMCINVNFVILFMVSGKKKKKSFLNLILKPTPNAQNPNTMMMKSTVSARNIST